jgi:hypothetical protein
LVTWIEQALDELIYGEISVIFHIRCGKIEWVEKVKKETIKTMATGPPK